MSKFYKLVGFAGLLLAFVIPLSSAKAAVGNLQYHGFYYVEDASFGAEYISEVKDYTNIANVVFHCWRENTLTDKLASDLKQYDMYLDLEIYFWDPYLNGTSNPDPNDYCGPNTRTELIQYVKDRLTQLGILDRLKFVAINNELQLELYKEYAGGGGTKRDWNMFKNINNWNDARALLSQKYTETAQEIKSKLKTSSNNLGVYTFEPFWRGDYAWTNEFDYIGYDIYGNNGELRYGGSCDNAADFKSFARYTPQGGIIDFNRPAIVSGPAFENYFQGVGGLPLPCQIQAFYEGIKDFNSQPYQDVVYLQWFRYFDINGSKGIRGHTDQIATLKTIGQEITGRTGAPTTPLSLNPSATSITVGGNVSAQWSNHSSAGRYDWVGLYKVGASSYVDWKYLNSCSQTVGSSNPSSSGSCGFNIGEAGTYEFRIYNAQSSLLATSANKITVSTIINPGTGNLSVSPSSVAVGGSINVSWSNISSPTKADWVGLYPSSTTPDNEYVGWFYVRPTSGVCLNTQSGSSAAGTCSYNLGSKAPGTSYEFRLFSNNGYTKLATTNSFTITGTTSNNLPPVTNITEPLHNASRQAPAYVTIKANASDSDGTIAKVEFYNGSIKLFEDTSAPYQYEWPNVAIGTYTLTVRAYDDKGASAVSSPVNLNVIREIINPPVNPTLSVSPTTLARGNSVTVTWFDMTLGNNQNWIGLYAPLSLNSANLDFKYLNTCAKTSGSGTPPAGSCSFLIPSTLNAGSYEFRLFDGLLGQQVSTSNQISVTGNNLPTVSITEPLHNASRQAPAYVTIKANASDSDGTITKVEFYNGSTKLFEDTSAPYQYEWVDVPTGTYELTAKAYDNSGASVVSSIVKVNVITINQNKPPIVSIVEPANNATGNSPASLTLRATATDEDGTISKVEFYNGSSRLGEIAAAPYQLALTNLGAGEYTFTAKATDNTGALSTSQAIKFTVSPPSGGGSRSGGGGGTTVSDPNQAQIESLLATLRVLVAQARSMGIVIPPALEQLVNSGTTFTSTTYYRDLAFGARGADVSSLQRFLISQNKGPSARTLALYGATGYFGSATVSALVEFQLAMGISPASGAFGPKTRSLVNSMR